MEKYAYKLDENPHPNAKPIEYIITEEGCWTCISHIKKRLRVHGGKTSRRGASTPYSVQERNRGDSAWNVHSPFLRPTRVL